MLQKLPAPETAIALSVAQVEVPLEDVEMFESSAPKLVLFDSDYFN